MKAFLMFPNKDFNYGEELPFNNQTLIDDLGLEILISSMAKENKFLHEVCKFSLLTGFQNSISDIQYRQEILEDCLANPSISMEIFMEAWQAVEEERKTYYGLFKTPDSIVHRSLQVIKFFLGHLKRLRTIADEYSEKYHSEGFVRFFQMIKSELNDAYLLEIESQLKELAFKQGILISAKLGKGNKGINHVLRRPNKNNKKLIERLFIPRPTMYSLTISERDDRGYRALAEIRDRGLAQIADALSQSVEHILSFFVLLKTEMALYIGCINLQEKLNNGGHPYSFPIPSEPHTRVLNFRGLYDISLALSSDSPVIGNDLETKDKSLFIITGANQGGKTTYLRGLGSAQLMMQCGMFVPAEYFSGNLCESLFSHFRKEEDETMNSGKLDEELSRISNIIDNITSNSIFLFNESFSATNEREGSEIGRQIVTALVEEKMQVFFVTHQYEFANKLLLKKWKNIIFLRAERLLDGTRTFKITIGEPLETSFGLDVYTSVFEKQTAKDDLEIH
jgi:DNA mismatch repair ATPase MutS